ncbi:MAG: lamin tail domain-containing protein, partial [Planctomycetales bacterium]|nr:lamin tail domain-containing protein [Planctomycetales bacterium]
ASDQTDRSEWQTIRYRGIAQEPNGSNNPDVFDEFIFGLLDAGEILVDDISVIEDPDGAAIERIQDGGFDGGGASYRLVGNHGQHGLSQVVDDPTSPGNNVLHLVATGATEHMSNHVETTFANGAQIVNGREYEISMRVRPLSGSPQLNTRLYFNRLARTTILDSSADWGTPGQINSAAAVNIGPNYEGLSHLPTVPPAGQPITVSVTASDPQGVASMSLWYSVDGDTFTSVGMVAGSNGKYVGTIPGQEFGAVIQFYVEGQDSAGAISQFPAAGPQSRALIAVQDNAATSGPQHNFRIVMTEADHDLLFDPINVMTNDRFGATVIFGEQQVYYDVGIRLKGSGFSRGSAATGYNLRFQPDQLLFGVHDVVAIDRQGGPWGIGASHRELVLKHIGNAAGDIPMMYDDAIYLIAPDVGLNGTAQLLAARFDDEFLENQYDNGGDGTRFKFDLIYYSTLTETGGLESFKLPPGYAASGVFPVLGVDIQDMGDDPNSYRLNYLIRNNRARDDFSRIIDMAQAFSLTGSTVGGTLDVATRDVIDVDQWMRLFAFESLVGINDTYNQGLPHNIQFYVRPEDQKVLAFPWDMDFSFHQSTTMPIYGTGSNLRKVIDVPSNRRLFQGHLYDIINTTYNVEYLTPWVQHVATRAVQDNTSEILSYVTARRNFVLSQLLPEIDFEITTNGGNDFTVSDSPFVGLSGNGWIDVREIRLAGSADPLTIEWTDDNSWLLQLPLDLGANDIQLEAYNHQGNFVGADSITVTSSVSNPVATSLAITEIHYNPAEPTPAELGVLGAADNNDFEFLEFANLGDETINVNGVQIVDGVSFVFGEFELTAGERAVVVRSEASFVARYGAGAARILGEFTSGQLSNGGERVTLATADGMEFASVDYRDSAPWPESADGLGASLELADSSALASPSVNGHLRLWRGSTVPGGTPGMANGTSVGVMISEIVSRTQPDGDLSDSIELRNVTAGEIDISGWYLSDAAGQPFKFQIPAGTVLSPGSSVVFDESDFNPNPTSPGPNDFGLDGSGGDDLWLTQGDSLGGIGLFVDEVHFGAAREGESLGRIDASSSLMVPLSRNTLGCENTPHRVGPAVISELNLAPGTPSAAAIALDAAMTADDLEYVELYNPTNASVDLTDWRVRGGVDYDFGATPPLAAGGVILLVSFNPVDPSNANRLSAFRAHYALDESVRIAGGYAGNLDDFWEIVRLEQPDVSPPDAPTLVPYVTADIVFYDQLDPWPDATGTALQRVLSTQHGSDPANWTSAVSPGVVDYGALPNGDFTADGIVSSDDVDLIYDSMRFGYQNLTWDLNVDGQVSRADAVYLVEQILNTRLGDANLDGAVDGSDYAVWQQSLFASCGSWARGDFNGDGGVDVADFNLWNANKFTGRPNMAQSGRTPRPPGSSETPTALAIDDGLARSADALHGERLHGTAVAESIDHVFAETEPRSSRWAFGHRRVRIDRPSIRPSVTERQDSRLPAGIIDQLFR